MSLQNCKLKCIIYSGAQVILCIVTVNFVSYTLLSWGVLPQYGCIATVASLPVTAVAAYDMNIPKVCYGVLACFL